MPGPGADPGGQPIVELLTHCAAEEAPEVADTVYSGHGVHEVALVVAPYESPAHARQKGVPTAGAYVPAAHTVQLKLPGKDADPDAHGWHVATLVALRVVEYVPPGHKPQFTEASANGT